MSSHRLWTFRPIVDLTSFDRTDSVRFDSPAELLTYWSADLTSGDPDLLAMDQRILAYGLGPRGPERITAEPTDDSRFMLLGLGTAGQVDHPSIPTFDMLDGSQLQLREVWILPRQRHPRRPAIELAGLRWLASANAIVKWRPNKAHPSREIRAQAQIWLAPFPTLRETLAANQGLRWIFRLCPDWPI